MMPENTNPFFRNRQEAGEELGRALEKEYGHADVLVLGIPRGGVVVGYFVALHLHAPLSVLVSRKLPYPGQEEFGFGALAEENFFYISPGYSMAIPEEKLQAIILQQKLETRRRINKYRQGNPLPSLKNKTVLLIDDGIATGVTYVPAIRCCRKLGARKIVVAAPVSGASYDPHLQEADEIRVLYQPEIFYGVGQAYEDFAQVSDEEVCGWLQKAAQQKL